MVYRCAAFGDVVEWEDGVVGRGGCFAERDVAALDHEARHEPVEGSVIVCAACAKGEEVLRLVLVFFLAWGFGGDVTSAVSGTVSQNISTFKSPWVVCSCTYCQS